MYIADRENDRVRKVTNLVAAEPTRTPSAYPTVAPSPTDCADGYTYLNDTKSCYLFNESSVLTYAEATEYCSSLGSGWLVAINDSTENSVVSSICDYQECWIGYDDIDSEGVWVWQHGNSTYTNWYDGEPNNGSDGGAENCAITNRSDTNNGSWNDVKCDNTYRYVCESEPMTKTPAPSSEPARTPSAYPTVAPSPTDCADGYTYLNDTKSCYLFNESSALTYAEATA